MVVVEVVVLVLVSRELGNEETIRSARLELIITRPSFSKMLSTGVEGGFIGTGGATILIGGGTVLDLEEKF